MRRALRSLTLVFTLAALLAPGLPARAGGKLVIKLATLAPEGTTWYNGLREMGDRWSEISGGKVTLKIYAGGVAGNEGTMVRKMRIGQVHAAALTNLGLMDIDPAPQVLNAPMLIQDYDELDYVKERLCPDLEARLADKGYIVLNWGDAGWAHFFTKTPMKTPEDAAKLKVWAWEGDPGAVEGFRKAGFNPVVLPSVDMIPSLQSGLIDGFPNTPLYALSAQWFALAPNMLDLGWAPLVGATVITEDVWKQVPDEYQEPFMTAAREIGDSLEDEIRRQDQKAVTVMQKYGLNVVEVDEANEQRWREAVQAVYPLMRTEIVPTEIWDRTVELVEEYRAAH